MAEKNRNSKPSIERPTFLIPREMEFFTEKELDMQIGHPRASWPIALTKEIIDNSLDAAEKLSRPPEIEIHVEDDSVSVQDNGPGIPSSTIDASLNYLVRASDKAFYVSPTRGQLGNALKCLWAAPFVFDGEQGRVEVGVAGALHRIEVSVDRIAGKVRIERSSESYLVKNGTLICTYWPKAASYLACDKSLEFYKLEETGGDEWDHVREAPKIAIADLVKAYAAFNPHASFRLTGEAGTVDIHATPTSWKKWLPSYPTCPHWYSVDRLRDLIAALVSEERTRGEAMTLRAFLEQFSGLRGPPKQKEVAKAAGLHSARLADLVHDDDVDLAAVGRLLDAMQNASRPIRSKALGILGETHLTSRLVQDYGVTPQSIRYKPVFGNEGLPFVLEVAFGVKERDDAPRTVRCGVNWSPSLGVPFPELFELLGQMRVDAFDPVVLLVHLAIPRVEFTDRGKSQLSISWPVREALAKCLRYVCSPWKKEKRQSDTQDRISQRRLEELRRVNRPKRITRIDAAWQVMEEAYLDVVDNDKSNPAHARQIMYKARKLILALTDGKFWKKSSSFTQQVLPEFVHANPDLTKDWIVVFDARGHLTEPHTQRRVELGTLPVRRYVQEWNHDFDEHLAGLKLSTSCPTVGPTNRYKFVLFLEKEGFDEHLKKARISELYDLPIMSTKGMSVTAARELAEAWARMGVTILVLHDFDKSGFSILHTLRNDSPRYQFKTKPLVIDCGLRLEDVRELGLEGEPVEYLYSKVDPRINLRRNGATDEECAILVRLNRSPWSGMRCELNEMTTPGFIAFIKRKLESFGVKKVIPDEETLKKAFLLAWRKSHVQDAMDRAVNKSAVSFTSVPHDLGAMISEMITGTSMPWDEALNKLVRKSRRSGGRLDPNDLPSSTARLQMTHLRRCFL